MHASQLVYVLGFHGKQEYLLGNLPPTFGSLDMKRQETSHDSDSGY